MIIFFCLCQHVLCTAQTKGVIADMESRKPLRDVTVHSSANEIVKTNYLGRFVLISTFTSVTITCKGFLSRTLNRDEMQRDTIFLLPRMSELDEVVIYAKAPKIGFDLKSLTKDASLSAPRSGGIGAGFDFFKPLERFDRSKRYVSRKQRRKQKEILDNY